MGARIQVLAIGASTGGTEALREVLTALPVEIPGIVIVQHLPAGFTAAFARRLNRLCALRVQEAEDGDLLMPGHVFIAPGNRHTTVLRSGSDYRLCVTPGSPINRHCPSIDVLFHSCAEQAGNDALAALLTGM